VAEEGVSILQELAQVEVKAEVMVLLREQE
jgi:hypothetical protein